MKKRIPAKSRVPLGTAVKEEIYERILRLRDRGYTVGQLLIKGIKVAEKEKQNNILT